MFVAKPPHTNRGISRELLNLSRRAEILHDPGAGFDFFDDFLYLPTGKYTFTDNTAKGSAATFALTDADGGVAILDSVSTTTDEGGNVQLGGAAGETFLPEADTEIIFEARLKIHDIGTDGAGLQFFIGLAETDTQIIASGANASANHIGFEAIASDGLDFVSEKATARGTLTDVHTIVDSDVTAGSWFNIGFRVIGLDKIEAYVAGELHTAATIATANIPIVAMRPSLELQNEAGASDPLLHLDWWWFLKKYRIG